jgi:NAD+ kinase
LRRHDPSVESWAASHRSHIRTLDAVERTLDKLGARIHLIQRPHAQFDTSDAALVVSVGGDGTLLAASHNVGSAPILGVNSAPDHSIGFFCAARRTGLKRMLEDALEDRLKSVSLTRMIVEVNRRIRARRVLNEALFSHPSPAATSRYILRHGKRLEEQRSSGFWVGPAAGSTAAQLSSGGRVLPLASTSLQLVVREPYRPWGRQPYRMLRLLAARHEELVVTSKMSEASLFLDGPYEVVRVRLGDELRFRVSDEPLTVLGLSAKRERG